jgi:serine/threonine-protein kinase
MKVGRISESTTVDFLRQAASAIDHANRNGVIHRDLKPANVMLHQRTTIKITDFGIARMAGARHRTATGLVMGTPSYMSPEQIRAMPLDGRSDQFALAAIAYELLTGRMSFPGETMAALYLIVEGKRPSARAVNPELPPQVDEVFYRALAQDAGQRYASSTEFVEALATALAKPVIAPAEALD